MKAIVTLFLATILVTLGGCSRQEPVCIDCNCELDIHEVIAKYRLPEPAAASDGTVLAATDLR
ncbi:MAG: hypothetical protein WCZ89_06170 [Phycisphaerae bacterium]